MRLSCGNIVSLWVLLHYICKMKCCRFCMHEEKMCESLRTGSLYVKHFLWWTDLASSSLGSTSYEMRFFRYCLNWNWTKKTCTIFALPLSVCVWHKNNANNYHNSYFVRDLIKLKLLEFGFSLFTCCSIESITVLYK